MGFFLNITIVQGLAQYRRQRIVVYDSDKTENASRIENHKFNTFRCGQAWFENLILHVVIVWNTIKISLIFLHLIEGQ